jgi:uncharacterized membrane protein YfcA
MMPLEIPSLVELVVLAVAGLLAGFVNTLAGAGSLLTLPALLMLGMPADVANATNRVGVFLAAAAGASGFAQGGMLDKPMVARLSVPVLIGAVLGALVAVAIPEDVFRPVLLGMMVLVGGMLIWKPNVVAPPEGTVPVALRDRPLAVPLLVLLGAYAAFLQAGMGIFTLLLISGVLRYDLLRANALKTFLVLAITVVALAIFIWHGKVSWLAGLYLGVFQLVGARAAVKFSLRANQTTLKNALLAIVAFAILGTVAKDYVLPLF